MSQEMPKGPITRGDIFASWLRWLLFSHANYNWERYQGTGFAHAMAPIIKKLYKAPEDIKAALKRHLVFFNTEPDTGGVIHGMVIALEEQRAQGKTEIDDETITNVKIGLMGPFAGLGDTLKQGIWFPVFQSIGISVAVAGLGSLIGPLIFLIASCVYTFVFGWWVYYQGYVQGQALVTSFLQTGLLDDIRTAAGVLGAIVLGALGASPNIISVSSGVNWTVVSGSGADAVTTTFSLQTDLFDKLFPSLLPLVTILFIIWLLRRGISPITVILYLFGITLGSVLIESVSRYAITFGTPLGVVSQVTQTQVNAGLFAADRLGSMPGLPTLIGMLVLIAGSLWAGSRAGAMSNAVRFVFGFLIVAVVFAFLSVGRSEPLQLLRHF